MYLSAYHFDGEPARLALAHDEMTARVEVDAMPLHVCVLTPGGIVVLDACPSKEVADSFQNGPEFAAALAAAGLPTPRIEGLGEIWSLVGVS